MSLRTTNVARGSQVLEGTMSMGGVDVALRALNGKVVLAKTISNCVDQVTFPDVPPRGTNPGRVAWTT